MPSVTNKTGDTVTFNRGGFNSDNLVGTVTDKVGGLIGAAQIEILNRSRSGNNVSFGQTDGAGRFDIDANAAEGDNIFITVTFTDSGGARRVISGTVTSN